MTIITLIFFSLSFIFVIIIDTIQKRRSFLKNGKQK